MDRKAQINLAIALVGVLVAGVIAINWPVAPAGAPQIAALAAVKPTITNEAPTRGNTHWELVFTVISPSQSRGYSRVGVDCTFIAAGKPVDVAGKLITNLAAGEVSHQKVIGPEAGKAVDNASCRVDYAYPA